MENNQQFGRIGVNSTSLTLGIVGVVVGVVALLGCWIPVLSGIVIPSGIIGFLLAMAGVGFACFKRFRSIELPILASVLCIIAISISAYSSYEVKRAQAKEEARERQKEVEKAQFQAEERQREVEQAVRDRQQQKAELKARLIQQSNLIQTDELVIPELQGNFNEISAKYEEYQAHPNYLTNSVYKNLKAQIAIWQSERFAYAQSMNVQAYPNGSVFNNHDGAANSRQAFSSAIAASNQDSRSKVYELDIAISNGLKQLKEIVAGCDNWQRERYNEAQSKLEAAQSKVDADKSEMGRLQSQFEALADN